MTEPPIGQEILQAARRWKTDCLLNDGSVFLGVDHSLWTLENFLHLDRYYVQNLKLGEGDFRSKLRSQLEPAPPEAKQLAAELLWVLYLIANESFIGARTKRYQIKQIWEWSGTPLPSESWALGSVLAAGVSNPGPAYHTHRWSEVLFAVTTFRDWKRLGREERARLLESPWDFAEWLEAREHSQGRQFRHVLLFLLFPDTFERITTASHKREITRRFRKLWGEEPATIAKGNRVALDREIARIKARLREEHSDPEIDFYSSPVVELWWKEKPAGGKDDGKEVPLEEEGHVVIAKHGRSKLLGRGRVTGPYRHEPERVEYRNVVPVDWKATGNPGAIPSARFARRR